jgi:hypothetical protein
VHVQPVPVAALKVNPAGNVSVTVIVPEVADVPVLLTAIVYVPVVPIVKLPACVLAIAKTGCVTVVGSVAVAAVPAPPPEAVALLVTCGTAAASALTVSEIGAPFAATAMAAALVQVTI